jgi:putative transposase
MEQWDWLGKQYPYIDLISFVVMPDHVHGVIFINNEYYIDSLGNGRDHSLTFSTDHSLSNIQNNIPPKIKPLPELIGAYKTTVSKRIHLAGDVDFKWQKSYYDHIVRVARYLNSIVKYIETNPANWDRQKNRL